MSSTISRERVFAEWLASQPARPFDWQSDHCGHYAADWVRHAEQRDDEALQIPAAPLRDLLRMLDEHGGLPAVITAALGREPLDSPWLAQVGDLVLLPADGPTGWAIGLVNGPVVLSRGEGGEMVFAPLDMSQRAWRVEVVTEGRR